MKELTLDIEEIQQLLDTQAQRPNVKMLLGEWANKLKQEKSKMEKILEQEKPRKIEKPQEEIVEKQIEEIKDPVSVALNAIENTKYETITKFGWEQDKGKVKVYITSLDGVGSIPKENITCEFEDKSFDLRI